jgi:hypothetical protein
LPSLFQLHFVLRYALSGRTKIFVRRKAKDEEKERKKSMDGMDMHALGSVGRLGGEPRSTKRWGSEGGWK